MTKLSETVDTCQTNYNYARVSDALFIITSQTDVEWPEQVC